MKKLFSSLLVMSLLLVGTQSFAQYQKGDKLLNAGIGLSSYYGGGLPIGASFEVGITDEISVGAQVDFYTWGYNFGGYKWRYTFLPIAVRGSYHVNELLNLNNDKLDLYGGLALGYYISSFKDNSGYSGFYDNAYGNQVLFGVHLGGRYYFKPNLGAFAEVGYGVSALKLGVAFKF
ncbi:hypothetical protein [Larkinella punicea]|uniref:Outer membrane protein beta-barrel domain-containing protein n=1 Tax=Larkinella punicea TaxID=2315727 RepID=A0A368JVW5_9BACT|nr:hypothetical protein [Larkinella punicea]RCR71505.1 hypothetical protein DUE52_00810 [Larkinella punicea]